MSTTASQASSRAGARDERTRPLAPADVAWMALIPTAAISLAAVLLLGPPLGRVLFPHGHDLLWPPTWVLATGRAEPTKHARYVIAALAPLLLAAVVLLGSRRRWSLPPRTTRAVVLASELALVAFVAFGLLGQQGAISPGSLQHPPQPIFALATLAGAAVFVVATLGVLRSGRLAAPIARALRETTARRRTGMALAATASALWLFDTVLSDRAAEDYGTFNWTLNDAFAVLDGRTPLVDYRGIYGKLVPYPSAAVLAIFGASGFVYSLFLAILSALALVAVYAILRRIAGSTLPALALFLPFSALSAFGHIVNQAGLWPMRYGPAYLVAWLTALHLDGRRPRRAWVLFLVGGLGAVNSVEFGLGALGGSALALALARPPRTPRAALRLAGEAAVGVVGAIALVSTLTLARAGRLPDPAVLLEWPRVFTNLGWSSQPVPVASMHLALLATFAGAVVVAAVRSARGDRDVLTGMVAWSGVFGLGAGAYYIGHAEDGKLIALFSAWAFSLVLLTVVCVRALAARGWRGVRAPELLVLVGFAVAAWELVHVPSPVVPMRRLASAPAPQYRRAAEAFVGAHTRHGEKVAILLPEGHRIAYDLGLDNVSPYAFLNVIVTWRQMHALIDTVRREHVHAIFLPAPESFVGAEGTSAPEQIQLLEAAGYRRLPLMTNEGFIELRRDGP
jgi:hypothetical protein